MAQLITDYDGLLALKRALSRFNLIIRESIEDHTEISNIVNLLLSGTSSLSRLLRVAHRYDVVVRSLKDCTPLCGNVDLKNGCNKDFRNGYNVDFRNGCNCNDGTISQRRDCNRCEGGPYASELFGAIDSLNTNQNLVITLSDELSRLIRAIAAYYERKCDKLPCEDKLEELISRLICCDHKPIFNECEEFDRSYPIALVIFIALLYNGAYPRVKCLICNVKDVKDVKDEKNCGCINRIRDQRINEHFDNSLGIPVVDQQLNDELLGEYPRDNNRNRAHHRDNKHECPCEGNNCKCLDPCAPCITSLYELSLGGLQVLLTIDGHDDFNKFFKIIGLDLHGIVRQRV